MSGRLPMPGDDEYLYAAVPLNRDGAGDRLFLATVTPVQSWYQLLRNPALKRDRNGLLWMSFQVGLVAFAVLSLLLLSSPPLCSASLERYMYIILQRLAHILSHKNEG